MSPFHFYNLRRNPFGELSRDERAQLAVVDIRGWLDYLQNDRSVLQFIGPCGYGKTTHLIAIQAMMVDAEYVYLPEVGPQPSISKHRPLIIDEAQRLSFLRLRRVLKWGGPLVIATHVDLSNAIRRAHLEVKTVDVAANSSSQRLAAILNRRLEASRYSDGELPRISDAFALNLHNQFGANIRAIEHHLYEQFQRCVSEQSLWPPVS